MPRTFKIEAGNYVVVKYNYKGDILIPGTTGKQIMSYWVKVEKFDKDEIDNAFMKFAIEAAENLPYPDHVEVVAVATRIVPEQELKL